MIDALRRRIEKLEGGSAGPWVFISLMPDGAATVTYHGDSRGGPHAMEAAEAQALAERWQAEGRKVIVFERRIVDPMPGPTGVVH